MEKQSAYERTIALEQAVQRGSLEEVEQLLQASPGYDAFDFTARALAYACCHIGADMVRLLLDHGASFEYELIPDQCKIYRIDAGSGRVPNFLLTLLASHREPDAPKRISEGERAAVVRILCARHVPGLHRLLYEALVTKDERMVQVLSEGGVQRFPNDVLRLLNGEVGSGDWKSTRDGRLLAAAVESSTPSQLENILGRLQAAIAPARIKLPDSLCSGTAKGGVVPKLLQPEMFAPFLDHTDLVSKSTRRELILQLIRAGNLEGVAYLFSHGYVRQLAAVDEAIAELREERNPNLEAIALLMDCRNNMRAAKRASSRSDLDINPFSAAELRKSWKYESIDERSIRILSYKGSETAAQLPPRIGKRVITEIAPMALSPRAPGITPAQVEARSRLEYVQLPAELKRIGSEAFEGCTAMTAVDMPATVTEIGDNAFRNCESLNRLTFPAALEHIGKEAFAWSGLEQADLSGTSVQRIDPRVFASCRALSAAAVPTRALGPKSGDHMFDGCAKLQELRIEGELTRIPAYFLADCAKMTTLEVPDTVTNIGDGAFSGAGLTSCRLPDGVTKLGRDVFRSCSSLRSVRLPKHLRAIPTQMFLSCRALKAIDWPLGLEVIGNEAFRSTGITKCILPDSVREIKDYAFSDCQKLATVTVPGLKALGAGAFWGCVHLQKVQLPDTMKILPAGVFQDCEKLADFVFPAALKDIHAQAFANTGLCSVQLPAQIRLLAEGAFQNCRNLQTVSVPGKPKLKEKVFSGCTDLREIGMSNEYVTIPDGLFVGCRKLTSFTISPKLKTIGAKAFFGTGLTEIRIPETVKMIREHAFQGASLRRVQICGDPKLGDEAFRGCPALAFVDLGTHLTSLAPFIFYECKALKEIQIPPSITDIDPYAFCETGLESITIPATVAYAGEGAFMNCKHLQKAVVEGDTDLGSQIFANCVQLENVELADSVEVIPQSAFHGAKRLKSLAFPKHLQRVGYRAFSGTGVSLDSLPEDVTKDGPPPRARRRKWEDDWW